MQELQQSELGILVDSPWKLIAYHSLNSDRLMQSKKYNSLLGSK